MSAYSSVSIIFNPKSTGQSEENARNLQFLLRRRLDEIPVRLIPTKSAGHAEQLAYNAAKTSSRPLIISSSGDGGYNEVINGTMKAQSEGAQVTTGLLPSGNANDHYNSLSSGQIERLIADGTQRQVDLLQVTTRLGSKVWQRYAHSYVGVGLTAKVGIELNRIDLNPVNEWVVAIRTIYNAPPSKISVNETVHEYDSLILSNINRFAKVFSLPAASRIDDGKFEVIALEHKTKAVLLQRIIRAFTTQVEDITHASHYSFTVENKQPIQLDGEIFTLQTGTSVEVVSVPKVLTCVL